MKQPRNRSSTTDFSRAIAKVRQSKGGSLRGLSLLRHEATPQLLRATAGDFASHAAYQRYTLKSPFPSQPNQLPARGAKYVASFERELAWILGLFDLHSMPLNEFCRLRQQFEYFYVSGKHVEAENILDEVESRWGFSLWLVQRRMDTMAARTGSASRSRYLGDLFANGGPSVAKYIMTWFGYRSSGSVSRTEFDRIIAEAAPFQTGLHYLLHLDSGSLPPLTKFVASKMIAWTDVLPIIDRYLFIIATLQLLISSDDLDDYDLSSIHELLRELSERIDDPWLKRISFLAVAQPGLIRPDQEFQGLLDDYASGSYEYIVDTFVFDKFPKSPIEALNIAVRAHTIIHDTPVPLSGWGIDPKSVAGRIAPDLAQIFGFSEAAIDARLRLTKLLLTHATSAWAASLSLILDRQRNDERVGAPTRQQKYNALRSSIDHPILAFSYPGDHRNDYLASFHCGASRSLSAESLEFVAGAIPLSEVDNLPLDRTAHIQALRAIRDRALDRASEYLNELSRTSDATPLGHEAALLRVECDLQLARVRPACDLAAALFVERRYYGLVLPITRLVEALMVGHNLPLSKSATRGYISVAIIFDIYSRFVASNRDAERADAFNDVLRRYGVSRASELVSVVPAELRSQLIYFLRYICIPEVLDQSLILDGTRSVEDERLAVLLTLIDLSSDANPSLEAFKDEIREIRTRQVVRDTTLKLDQSKIYVNTDGIRRVIDVEMRENWSRYHFMVLNGSEAQLEDIDRILFSSSDEQERVVVLTLNTPYSEREALFRRMVSEIRDQFTTNKEFGLNSNLSANIRHGYVLRELRGPLTSRNLVTNRISQELGYNRNLYWEEKIDEEDETAAASLRAELDILSRRVDELIDRLNRILLRIRTEANPLGLFNYNLSEPALAVLDESWGKLDTYEEFIDAIFDAMWTATESNLKNVRAAFINEILQKFLDYIDEFSAAIDAAGIKESLPSIVDAMTAAKTDMRAAVERVASWFTLSSNHEYADFDLEIAFEAGLASVKAYYANLDINHTYEATPSPINMMGWSLPAFARLFFQILDNAALHGGVGRNSLEISADIELDNDGLLIRIDNDLPEDADRNAVLETIAKLNSEYGQAKAMDLIGEEGGSGYPKIWKLVRSDLRRDHDISISLTEDKFRVEILMNAGGLICRTS